MYNVNITIMMRDIPVETEEECVKWLKEYFDELAGSNDGSEFLANLLHKSNKENIDLDLWKIDFLLQNKSNKENIDLDLWKKGDLR